MLLSREAQLAAVVSFLDDAGVRGKTAEAQLVLGNEDLITVRAGGPGVRSWPAEAPYSTYEVVTSGEPPRFWHRYTDSAQVVYAYVPRLLIAHHISRSGGIVDMELLAKRRQVQTVLSLKLMVADGADKALGAALRGIEGVRVLSTQESPV